MAEAGNVERRALLGWVGAGLVGAAAGGAAAVTGEHVLDRSRDDARASDSPRLASADRVVPRSVLPQGLNARTPAFGHLLSIDIAEDVRGRSVVARRAAQDLLRRLTVIADAASRGTDAGTGADAAGLDTRPASLQVTLGLGADLLTACGLPAPRGLLPIPAYDGDRLLPRLTGGDVFVQVGAEDPMRLAGAVQEVARALGPSTRLRWSRPGFRPTQAAADDPHATPRNLMGHRDGTANPGRDTPLWHSTVTTRDPGSWMDGGSYLVVRQIRIALGEWFDQDVAARDTVIGRDTATGAPLGRRREHAAVDLELRTASGEPAIGRHAHVRLAGTRSTAGARILRRGWNYDAGWTADGVRDAGLVFLAWQADLTRGFLPIQASLADGHDALDAFTTHIGSAVFAMPARGDDDYVGQRAMEG